MIDDTTYPQTTRSSDPHRQQDMYSNKRGKDEVALQGHLTCCAGRGEAVRAGKQKGPIMHRHTQTFTNYLESRNVVIRVSEKAY